MKAEKERSEKSLAELRAERESELESLQEERDRETEVGSYQSFASNYSLKTLESFKAIMTRSEVYSYLDLQIRSRVGLPSKR